jgi:multiple sugar transport system permease protein
MMVSSVAGSLSFRKHQHRLVPYLFIAPNISLFTAFSFLPLIYAVYISLHDWGLIGEPSFIGMRNYLRLWQDPLFWRALANTLLYAGGTVPTAMAIGLLLALALDRRLPARALFPQPLLPAARRLGRGDGDDRGVDFQR